MRLPVETRAISQWHCEKGGQTIEHTWGGLEKGLARHDDCVRVMIDR